MARVCSKCGKVELDKDDKISLKEMAIAFALCGILMLLGFTIMGYLKNY